MEPAHVTLQEVKKYLEDNKTQDDRWNKGIPAVVMQEIFKKNLSFEEVVKCAGVCKHWRTSAKGEPVGRPFITNAILNVPQGADWMDVYVCWLRTNHIIALDRSRSMNNRDESWREIEARAKVLETALRLQPVIERKGIKLILFAGMRVEYTIKKIEDVAKFLAHGDLGNQNNFLDAYNMIFQSHNKHWEVSRLPTHVTFISDMESAISVKKFMSGIPANIHFHFIQVGNAAENYQFMDKIKEAYMPPVKIKLPAGLSKKIKKTTGKKRQAEEELEDPTHRKLIKIEPRPEWPFTMSFENITRPSSTK